MGGPAAAPVPWPRSSGDEYDDEWWWAPIQFKDPTSTLAVLDESAVVFMGMDRGHERTDAVPQVAIFGAMATIAATLLGGGGAVIPLEDSVRQTGWVLSPLLFLIGASWSTYTSWLLIRASGLSGEQSYEELAGRTLGPFAARMVQILIVINSFFLGVSVLELFETLLEVPFSREMILVIGGGLMLPVIAMVRDIDRLSFVSYITACTAVIFVVFVIVREIVGSKVRHSNLNAFPVGQSEIDGAVFALPARTLWLQCFSTVMVAFVVQFNVLPLLQTFPKEHAESAMTTALFIGIAIPTIIYLTILLLSYRTFGDRTYEYIIEHYERCRNGPLILSLLGIGQLLSYPIHVHSGVTELSKPLLSGARALGLGLKVDLSGGSSSAAAGGQGVGGAIGGSIAGEASEGAGRPPPVAEGMSPHKWHDDQPVGSPAPPTEKTDLLSSSRPAPSYMGTAYTMAVGKAEVTAHEGDEQLSSDTAIVVAHAFVGTVWVVMTVVVAVVVTDVGELIALVGAFCAMPLMTIFPPLMYFYCPGAEDEPFRWFHLGMFVFGVITTIVCVWITVLVLLL